MRNDVEEHFTFMWSTHDIVDEFNEVGDGYYLLQDLLEELGGWREIYIRYVHTEVIYAFNSSPDFSSAIVNDRDLVDLKLDEISNFIHSHEELENLVNRISVNLIDKRRKLRKTFDDAVYLVKIMLVNIVESLIMFMDDYLDVDDKNLPIILPGCSVELSEDDSVNTELIITFGIMKGERLWERM